jgi:1,4-dihydroxy-2-naphthoate octaprenyltransferase
MTFKSIATDLLIPFIIGGVVFAGVKYSSTHLNNPALAAIIAAVPTGLLSAYFIKKAQIEDFSKDYLFNTLSLATAIGVMWALVTYTKMDKVYPWLIAIGVWLVLVIGRYFIIRPKNKTN